MADVGLPLVSRRSLQREDRRRPPFIFTVGLLISIVLRFTMSKVAADYHWCDLRYRGTAHIVRDIEFSPLENFEAAW